MYRKYKHVGDHISAIQGDSEMAVVLLNIHDAQSTLPPTQSQATTSERSRNRSTSAIPRPTNPTRTPATEPIEPQVRAGTPVAERCLYREARLEAERYGHEVAARLGSSFGAAAVSEWNRVHWWFWVCDRILEHVRGDVFWRELEGQRFATHRGGNGEYHAVTDEIGRLRRRLSEESALSFSERVEIEHRLASLVNRLLQ